ncbi:MAG: polysaccharide biosynthesis tyrosine autokinase [Pseudomonadota bacterium]
MKPSLHLSMDADPALPDPDADSDRVDLRSLVQHLWRRRWVAIGAAVAGAALAFSASSLVTPRYTARASVMLDARSVQVLSSDNVLSELNLNNPLLDTEAAVLRSNLLLERVVQSLAPEELALLDPSMAPVDPGWSDWLFGSQAAEPVAEEIANGEDRQMRRLVNALRQSITVYREGQSYVISVSVETENAALSTDIANTLIDEYIGSQIESRTAAVSGAATFLSGRVDEMRGTVEAAESAVEQFKIEQLALDGMSLDTMSQQLLGLSTQLALSRADLSAAQATSSQIEQVIAEKGIEAASELLSSAFVLSLRERLSEAQRQDADLATQLGPEHPDRQRLRASIALVTKDLADEVRKIVAQLKNDVAVGELRVKSLQDSVADLESRVADVSRASLELRQLEREATAVRGSYELMLSRLNETQSSQQFQRADARVVEKAVVPGAPSAPRTSLFTALGGATGLSLGVLALFLLEMTIVGYARKADVERATGLSVLGILPRGRWQTPRQMLQAMADHPYQSFTEQVRNLRTTLALRSTRSLRSGVFGGQSVLITSSIPGEGKTSTAIAFAHVEALAGKSVVLVDFDARRSNLASELGYAEGRGDLAACLRGICTVEDAVQRPEGLRFSLLTTLRPDPGLVDETTPERITALFDALKARFQVVVVDSPPVLVVSDTLLIARHVDAVVVLVKQGTTRRQALRDALKRLGETSARPAGLVISIVDPHDVDEAYGVNGSYEIRT